jgi:hypothetical protein
MVWLVIEKGEFVLPDLIDEIFGSREINEFTERDRWINDFWNY